MSDAGERVYVVDDDEAMRDSLVWLLESHGIAVSAFASAAAFLEAYRADLRGCLVLDVRMPGMSGLELHERLKAGGATLPVVFVTGHGDVPMAVSALKRGALDFVEKPFAEKDLLRLVRQALERDRGQAEARLRLAEVRRRLDSLTAREREVLALVVDGKPNKLVADELGISPKTVEVHRAHLMEKMGVGSLAELVRSVLSVR